LINNPDCLLCIQVYPYVGKSASFIYMIFPKLSEHRAGYPVGPRFISPQGDAYRR
jgi:hypothetical protein